VWSQVESQVGSQVASQVRSQVRSQVESQVWSQVGSQVGSQVASQVRSQIKDMKYIHVYESNINSDSSWVSFYDYFNQILKLGPQLNLYTNILQKFGYFTCWFNNAILTCDYPETIKFNNQGQSHCNNGPAYKWKNGEAYYVLNGVSVPKWFINKSIGNITRKDILSIENVEQRRELIRKLGIDIVINKMGAKQIDKKGDYELLTLNLSSEIKDCRYLKMRNPSIKTWHVEGVGRECKTVQEALNWRAGDLKSNWIPEVLT